MGLSVLCPGHGPPVWDPDGEARRVPRPPPRARGQAAGGAGPGPARPRRAAGRGLGRRPAGAPPRGGADARRTPGEIARGGPVAGMTPPLSGRRAEAARNDELVLEAARKVLIASPDAPMAQIADRAGVGIGTLYRRYPSKEALVIQLCLDSMQQLERIARAAVERARNEPWEAVRRLRERLVRRGRRRARPFAGGHVHAERRADGAQPLDGRGGGGARRDRAGGRRAARRRDRRPRSGCCSRWSAPCRSAARSAARALQHRYLALLLEALQAPGAGPLPAPPPSWQEISTRWSG